MKVSKYVNLIPYEGGLLAHGCLYNAAVKITSPERIAEFEQLRQATSIPDDAQGQFIEDLKSIHILVPDDSDECTLVNHLYDCRSKFLHVFLIVTRQCNFRCPYCYQDHSGMTMPWETYVHTKDFIIRTLKTNRQVENSLLLDFFGGEPTLETKNILRFLDVLSTELTENGLNPTLHCHITSNGYLLTPETFSKLVYAGVKSFQITLDGFSKSHNKSRYLAGGIGSWETIVNNLRAAKATDLKFHVQIRTNYTQEIVDSFPEFLSFLKAEFGGDDRFGFYFEAAKDYGTIESSDNLSIVADEAATTNYIRQLIQNSKLSGASMDGLGFGLPLGAMCYASRPYEIVVDYDGSLRKCTFNLDDPINKVGTILDGGKFNINLQSLADWTSFDAPTACHDCSIYPVCYGHSCPNVNRSTLTPDSPRCRSLKACYNSAVAAAYLF